MPRFLTDIPFEATALRANRNTVLLGRCTIIGEGGFGCHLPAHLSIGELLAIELPIPGTLIQTMAEIRYQFPRSYYGLEFLRLTWDERDALIRYCRLLRVAPDREWG